MFYRRWDPPESKFQFKSSDQFIYIVGSETAQKDKLSVNTAYNMNNGKFLGT